MQNLKSPENPSRYFATRELFYLKGKEDRKNGIPCRSANGRYLDGWYSLKIQRQR